jgi:methionyl-tRNA formyltransferase
MSPRNTFIVHNRKKIQDIYACDNNGSKFDKFVETNREAMVECLPKLTSSKKLLRSSDDTVKAARQQAQQAQSQYEASNLEEDRALVTLYQVYKEVDKEELVRQVQNIETAHGGQRYGKIWKAVNEITGRKSSKDGQLLAKALRRE